MLIGHKRYVFVVKIAAGDFHALALRSDGSVVGWGDDTYGQTDPPAGLVNASHIASGYYHGLALIPCVAILSISNTPAGVTLHWNTSGTLQWSFQPDGPYYDVPCSGPSFSDPEMSAPAKFYRIRR